MTAVEWPLLAGDEDLEAIGGGVGSSLCESGHSALPIELGSIPNPFRLSVQFKSIAKSFFCHYCSYVFGKLILHVVCSQLPLVHHIYYAM